MIKNILNKFEVKKFNNLLKKTDTVAIVSGDELLSVYDKTKKISYAPVAKLSIR